MKNIALLKSAIGSHGGLEKVAKRFMQELLSSGCRVTLLTTSSSRKPLPKLDPRIDVVVLQEDGPLSVSNLWRFDRHVQKWLKKFPQDIVFGFDRNSFQTHLRAGNGCHAAYLELRHVGFWKTFSFWINPLHRLLLSLEKRGFEHPGLRRLITNSNLVKEQILSRYNVASEKIHVLHNGVEWQEMTAPFAAFPQVRAELKKAYHIPEDHFILLFAGHGFRRKGLLLLLNALQGFDKVTLLVVGKDKKTPPPAPSYVRYLGPQASLLPFLQLADALCVPSLYDPFANVTVEALSMGLFVCSSPFNGGSEVLTDQSGIVIKDLFCPHSFKEALQQTFAHPKTETSARLIRQSVAKLDFDQQMKKLSEITLSDAC